MARDPLDAGIATLIDQAASVRDQLRAHKPAREALDAIGQPPDALADGVEAARLAAEQAHVANTIAHRRLPRATGAYKAVAADAREWMARLDLALRGHRKGSGPEADAAIRTVRARMIKERRRFRRMRTAVADLVPVMKLEREALPSLAALIEAGEALCAAFDRVHEALDALEVAASGAASRARAQWRALKGVLRDVRFQWSLARRVHTAPVPALDLRISEAAIAAAKRAPRANPSPEP